MKEMLKKFVEGLEADVATKASAKITSVFAKFEELIKDLNEGIEGLTSEVTRKKAKMSDLQTEVDSHLVSIASAQTIRINLNSLLTRKM